MISNWRKSSVSLGGALVLGLSATAGVAAPPVAPPPTPAAQVADDPGIAAIIAQRKTAQSQRGKDQIAKLKAAPQAASDEAYQLAAKKVGLDLGAMSVEYKNLSQEKDPAVRETKALALKEKYTPLILKLYPLAGVDVVAERKKAVLLATPPKATAVPPTVGLTIGPPMASPVVHELALTGVVVEPVAIPLPPPPPPPPPAALSLNLGPQFNFRSSTSRDFGAAQQRTGHVEAGYGSHFVDAGLEVSTLGGRFIVPAGYRRIDIVAEIDDVRWQLFGNALGHIYGEVRAEMLLNDGSQVLCEDNRQLGMFEASGVVGVSEFRHVGHLHFTCAYARPAGGPDKSLTATFSVWATSSSVGPYAEMFAFSDGRISAMHATISP